MKRIIVIAILAFVLTASLFAGYIGVEAGAGLNLRDIKIRNDEGEYVKKYSDEIYFISVTAIGEIMDYMNEIGFGGEVTFEKPISWVRYNKDVDVSSYPLKIRELCAYAIFPSGIYYTSTFNVDGGLFYRVESLASQVGGQRIHTIGAMGKFEYVFDNPSFVVPRIGVKVKVPLLTFASNDTRVITDGISLSAYLTVGFGE